MARPRKVYIGIDRAMLELWRRTGARIVAKWTNKWHPNLPANKTWTAFEIAQISDAATLINDHLNDTIP